MARWFSHLGIGDRVSSSANSHARDSRARKLPTRPLQLTSLESRNLLSANPLPVLLVVADQQDFYYREYSDTRSSLEQRGIEVVVAATTPRPTTPHWNTGQPAGTPGTIVPDIALANVDSEDYSAIVFVGGWGSSMYQYAYNDPNLDGINDNFYVNNLYNGDEDLHDGQISPQKIVVNNLINEFVAQNKHVGAICHGVTVLAWARVDGASPLAGKYVAVPHLEGSPDQYYAGVWRNAGYYNGQRDQVIDNGGIPTAYSGAHGNPGAEDDVIVDGRIITAENPSSALLFGHRIADEIIASLPPSNQPPVAQDAFWSVPENSEIGVVIGIAFAVDPDMGQSLRYEIIAGNESGAFAIHPSTGQIYVANSAPLDFESSPSFLLTVQVSDNGTPTLSDTATIRIDLLDVVESPVFRSGNNLMVMGTSTDDTIYVWSSALANQVYAWVNGTSYGSFLLPPGGRVIVHAGAGNDKVFATDLRIGANIFGEAGHDLITGGKEDDLLNGGDGVDRLWGNAGNDLILGGNGDDFLFGREGNDILIGGAGNDRIEGFDGRDLLIGGADSDTLFGEQGEDLLIGGTTSYDENEAQLKMLLSLWSSPASLEDRIASLTQPFGLGFRAGETVFDDGASDALIGGLEGDWLFRDLADVIYGLASEDRLSTV